MRSCRFPSNGHDGRRLPRRARVGLRSRRGRDPGVVGARPPHQGRVRPLRRRRIRRPGAGPLPRHHGGQHRARRGRQADDGAQRRSGGQGHERCGRPPAGARRRSPVPRSASSGSAWAAASPSLLAAHDPTRSAPACRSTASSPGRARRARLVEARGPGARPLRRERLHVHPGDGRGSSRPACRDLGKEREFIIHPGVDHAFFNDTRPEVHDAEASAAAWASVVPFLRANIT